MRTLAELLHIGYALFRLVLKQSRIGLRPASIMADKAWAFEILRIDRTQHAPSLLYILDICLCIIFKSHQGGRCHTALAHTLIECVSAFSRTGSCAIFGFSCCATRCQKTLHFLFQVMSHLGCCLTRPGRVPSNHYCCRLASRRSPLACAASCVAVISEPRA